MTSLEWAPRTTRSTAAAADYAYLRDVGRAGFAWEWLRRNPDYCAEFGDGSDAGSDDARILEINRAAADHAARWGLHFRRGSDH